MTLILVIKESKRQVHSAYKDIINTVVPPDPQGYEMTNFMQTQLEFDFRVSIIETRHMTILEWISFDSFFLMDFCCSSPLFFKLWPFDQLNLNQSIRFDSRIDVNLKMIELENG